MHNLLTDPLIRISTSQGKVEKLSLPQVMDALVRDNIISFPGLRPHQTPAWHMFLAQLGALALHRAGQEMLPTDVESWRTAIHALTSDFPEDEPWKLVVEDRSKPAFMQVPELEGGVNYTGIAESPDALDMLVTSKNHDLKQAVAKDASIDEWIFALVTLQTGEGYNGSGNNGIARMNGGSSSRVCLTLLPHQNKPSTPGARFRWETEKLLRDRHELLSQYAQIGYPDTGGHALLWTLPWPGGEKLQLNKLDPWFIEICRRLRLRTSSGLIIAKTGTTTAERIDAKQLKGVTGDSWAPVNVKGGSFKSLTLGEQDFSHRLLSNLFFGEDWQLPPMLVLSETEQQAAGNWLLIAQAIGRGNSKTYGYRERVLPISLKVAMAFGLETRRETLGNLAKQQIDEISKFKKVLGSAIALFVEGGDWEKVKKESYEHATLFQNRLDKGADALFFPALWQRDEAAQIKEDVAREQTEDSTRLAFLKDLLTISQTLLDEALGSLPCPTLYRHRATVLAADSFHGMITSEKAGFPTLRNTTAPETSDTKDQTHDAA